jgi:RNA polymerase sigma-70 factor (ECF subfamily)
MMGAEAGCGVRRVRARGDLQSRASSRIVWAPNMAETPPSALSDGDLARAIAAQPRAAQAHEAELFRRFAPRVRLYGLRHMRDGQAAEDLVQRVLVLTMQKLRNGEVREPDRLGSFVLGTARTMTREGRRADRMITMENLPEESALAPQAEPDPHLRTRLAEGLAALDERARAVLVLSFVQEQSSEEIGVALGLEANHVRVLRHRALSRLRACLGFREEDV